VTELTELVAVPERGRVFTQAVRPGLADCAPSGRIRLDALARWLQDVAYADVEDAGLAHSAVWVVRRTRITVRRFPRFAERFAVRTFCSGLGRMWAERRTTIEWVGAAEAVGGARGAAEPGGEVDAVSLWVHLDPVSWRPVPFRDEELAAYGDAAAGRRITARLRHKPPGADVERVAWRFRATECDIAGHINNAAYWQPLEEELLQSDEEPQQLDVEMEYRTPSQPGDKQVLRDGDRRWIVGSEGETHASVVLSRGEPGTEAPSLATSSR
jgi:acyl-ACP thioesterase